MLNETDIVEGNKLIELFIGFYLAPNGLFYSYESEFNQEPEDGREARNFHLDWSALMPVVEKIKKWYDSESDSYDPEEIDALRIFDLKIYEPIASVRYHVVQFIKWYNQNK